MHRFRIGDVVRIKSDPADIVKPDMPRGTFEVIRLLPPDHCGMPQYHVRSSLEIHARLVSESQLG